MSIYFNRSMETRGRRCELAAVIEVVQAQKAEQLTSQASRVLQNAMAATS
jgi:hypothetical protein